MDMNQIVERLTESSVLVPILIAGGIVMSVLIKTIGATVRTSARERTRREIAAYIAEGSMSPEQGERLMRADVKRENV